MRKLISVVVMGLVAVVAGLSRADDEADSRPLVCTNEGGFRRCEFDPMEVRLIPVDKKPNVAGSQEYVIVHSFADAYAELGLDSSAVQIDTTPDEQPSAVATRSEKWTTAVRYIEGGLAAYKFLNENQDQVFRGGTDVGAQLLKDLAQQLSQLSLRVVTALPLADGHPGHAIEMGLGAGQPILLSVEGMSAQADNDCYFKILAYQTLQQNFSARPPADVGQALIQSCQNGESSAH